jgi:hypothetical protein
LIRAAWAQAAGGDVHRPVFVDPAFVDPAFVDPIFADPVFADPVFTGLVFAGLAKPNARRRFSSAVQVRGP